MGRVRYDAGDAEVEVEWFQRDISGGEERRIFKSWAADKEAEENAVARILEEEKAWYWERTCPPYCLLAVPIGQDQTSLHWQTMKDPQVLAAPPPTLLTLPCSCGAW